MLAMVGVQILAAVSILLSSYATNAPENLAYQKNTWQSTTYTDTVIYASDLAVDGGKATNREACTRTREEPWPTWQVDLGNNYHVGYINITSRAKNTVFLYDFVVALYKEGYHPQKGPFPSSQVCHRHRGSPVPGETITITCHAAMTTTLARYVYVYLEGEARVLAICEFEVYGHKDSLTNVFLDGEACPDSILEVTMTSAEAVTDVLRDGDINSCVEPKTLTQTSFRMLVPSNKMLRQIRVISIGSLNCIPVYGMNVFGVKGCYGENVPCELQMCTPKEPNNQSNGIVYSFICPRNNYRYALLDIPRGALHNRICEISLY